MKMALAPKRGAGVPSGFQALYDEMRCISDDPNTAIDTPEAVVRMTVLDAMLMFVQLTRRPPRLLYLTKAMEAALQVDRVKNLGYDIRDGKGKICKIRDEPTIFTCRVAWDAQSFRVE